MPQRGMRSTKGLFAAVAVRVPPGCGGQVLWAAHSYELTVIFGSPRGGR